MMKLRHIERGLVFFIPFAIAIVLLIYLQLDTSNSTQRKHDTDFESMLQRERSMWQDRIRSLQAEMERLQRNQDAVLKNVNRNAAEGAQQDQLRHAAVVPPQAAAVAKPAVPGAAGAPDVARNPAAVAGAVSTPSTIGVLVVGCNRPDALKRSISQILKLRPSAKQFPIVVSLDCGHAPSEEAVKEFGNDVTVIRQPDLSGVDMSDVVPMSKRRMIEGYRKVSRHYKFALNEVFNKMKYETVVIVEDDLDVAVDFFDYMAAGERLMAKDKSIWCVSAWNDNGKEAAIDANKPELLYRTDFFPGLGWMLKRDTWAELGPKWPKEYWDDWMRNPKQRRGRVCLRPEVSRTYTFGLVGVSQGQYWRQYLQFILLNKKAVKFGEMNLDYLLKENYDAKFDQEVYASPEAVISSIPVSGQHSVRVSYTNNVDFKMKAKQMRIMDDLRAGVPRMAYQGIVPFMYNGQRVFLAPTKPWNGYVEK